jgi:hypothetical protein
MIRRFLKSVDRISITSAGGDGRIKEKDDRGKDRGRFNGEIDLVL